IDVLPDGPEQERLFSIAQSLMIRFVLGADHFVRREELVLGIDRAPMKANAVCFRVTVDIVRSRGRRLITVLHDRYAASRTDDVFDEEGHLAHHRAPSRFVPAD